MRSNEASTDGPALNEKHAALFFPGGDARESLKLLWREVQRYGAIADTRATIERTEIRRARRDMQHLHKTLDKIDRLTRWLPNKADVAGLAADLSRGVAPAGSRSAIQSLVHTIEATRDLRQWGAALREFKIAKAPPSHSDPLAKHFINLMARMFRFYRKKDPPRGRTGPFVHFLVAAWTDLKFPVPKDNDGNPIDFVTWLGQKVEKVPRLNKKLLPQKR
jgi:hypothetical protein